ncbi:copia protein [Tanacetum coccineum]
MPPTMTGNASSSNSYKGINEVKLFLGSQSLPGQICDNKCRVTFSKHDSEITKDGKVIGRGIRKKGLYVMKLGNKPKDQICLATIDESSMLWHKRLGYVNMRLIQSLASKELVRNLPKLKFDQHFCDACKIRKQAHAIHKAKNIVSTTRCLELLHMDLFGSSTVWSYGGKCYTLVIVDDYSRNKWELRNKLDENGIVSRNKARLVAQGYNQKEGIDYDETYALVARLESIRILLAYACALDFKLFQMDVKSAFLNGFINEENEIYKTNVDITTAPKAKELEANEALINTWEEIQANIDADAELAQKLDAEEQQQYTDADKVKLFMEFMEKRRKFFARKREIEKRNKPPTKAQQRKIMSTYLKNMDGWKHNRLKSRSFDEIQKLFENAIKRTDNFIDFQTELVEGNKEKKQSEVIEGSSKRSGEDLEQESKETKDRR